MRKNRKKIFTYIINFNKDVNERFVALTYFNQTQKIKVLYI